MIRRNLIHPEFPFTVAEHAAAWILLGTPADEAIRDSAHIADELAATLDSADAGAAETGWEVVGPRVHFVGSFAPTIHLAADIVSDGSLLSDTARAAWLDQWELRLTADEAERRVGQLDHLGPDWSARRSAFLRLLTVGKV